MIQLSRLATQLQARIDRKAKPLGALGRLEALALQIGRVQQTTEPSLVAPHLLVFAGDHGAAAQPGLSAYPQEITALMVQNFLAGQAAINVFTRQHGLALRVIDAGVAVDMPPHPDLVNAKVACGTQSYFVGPAMTAAQAQLCLQHGAAQVAALHSSGCNVLGLGEMGIGNTASASLIMACLLDLPLADCVGRGTGLDEAGVTRKRDLLQRVLDQQGRSQDPLVVLQRYGGFEIGMMAGAMQAAAQAGMLVLVDGFIATAAYLLAERMLPALREHAIFTHQSDEAGHRRMLQALEAQPLLQLDLRLGEGTGCALAYPLLVSAVAFLHEMGVLGG